MDDRTFDPARPVQAPVGWSKPALAHRYGDRHDVRPEHGDRHGVRYTDRERSTCNIQLSTFNGVIERAHGGRDIGTDTEFHRRPGGTFTSGFTQLLRAHQLSTFNGPNSVSVPFFGCSVFPIRDSVSSNRTSAAADPWSDAANRAAKVIIRALNRVGDWIFKTPKNPRFYLLFCIFSWLVNSRHSAYVVRAGIFSQFRHAFCYAHFRERQRR